MKINNLFQSMYKKKRFYEFIIDYSRNQDTLRTYKRLYA